MRVCTRLVCILLSRVRSVVKRTVDERKRIFLFGYSSWRMAEKSSSASTVGGRSRAPSGSSASLLSAHGLNTRSIEKSDNTSPITLQGSYHAVVDKVNNFPSDSEQAGNEDLRNENNENVCERRPTTLEEKHTAIVSSAHVDKSTVKTEGGGGATLSDTNGSEIPSRQHQTDIIPEGSEDVVETLSADLYLLVSHRKDVSNLESSQEDETFEELESWRNEGSPDRFSDAIDEEESYKENSLVDDEIFPPQYQESSSKNIPLPFVWPIED